MSTVRVRKLDSSHDLVFGNGKLDYLTDLDAVVQMIQTVLLLFQGEWWENEDEGLPLWQSILGMSGPNNSKVINQLIQKRIMETPHVTDVQNVSSNYNASARSYAFQATVNTEFGQVVVSNVPIQTGGS
jgi:hypothetical protein